MNFCDKLKDLRQERNLLQKQLAMYLDIDTPMYSKIERGHRKAKREQVVLLSRFFNLDENELLELWLADQVYELIKDEATAGRILRIAEDNIKYGK